MPSDADTKRNREEEENDGVDSIQSTARKALESNARIAVLLLRGANFWQRCIGYLCYAIVLIGLCVLLIPPYESQKQLLALFVCVPCLFIAFLLVFRRYSELTTQQPTSGLDLSPARPRNIQLPQPVFESVLAVLGDARSKLYVFLKQSSEALSDDQVRANIFSPTYGGSGDPGDYQLRIYPGLHLNMELPKEREISFQPKQGATGQAFEEGLKIVTQTLENGDGDWDEKFNMTEELSERVHPDLKWIISMPLTAGKEQPIGVLNIDGLAHQFKVDLLYEAMVVISREVIVVHGLVAET